MKGKSFTNKTSSRETNEKMVNHQAPSVDNKSFNQVLYETLSCNMFSLQYLKNRPNNDQYNLRWLNDSITINTIKNVQWGIW